MNHEMKEKKNGKIYCKYCGTERDKYVKFCENCGPSKLEAVLNGEKKNSVEGVKSEIVKPKLTRNVDIVLVIDSTSDMGNAIDGIKKNIHNFYEQLMESAIKKHKFIDKMRMRIISFRDYLADENPMFVSEFYKLPDETEKVIKALDSIIASGGGDEAEDGLEALAYAIRSKWDTSCMSSRHIIMLFTDAPAHELGYGKSSKLYPSNMAKTYAELSEWWDNSDYISQKAKRLVLFAPDSGVWNDISDNWSNVIHVRSKTGEGLIELKFQENKNAITDFVLLNM